MAANHIFGLGDVVATTATVVAILAVSAMPLYAQQPSTVQLNADAQNLFKIISSDKRKIQIFCKIADLGNQLDQADQVHDTEAFRHAAQNRLRDSDRNSDDRGRLRTDGFGVTGYKGRTKFFPH
jgi:hypothetical protein